MWQYFGFIKDQQGKLIKESRATCKICGQKVAHGGGTTNLKNHLQIKHETIYGQLYGESSGTQAGKQQSSLDSFVRSSTVTKLPSHSARAVQLTDAVVDFIARDLRPVNVVDGIGFLQLMQTAEPRYVVPCRKTMMSVIDTKYRVLKRTVRGAIGSQDSVALTTDMWTSRAGDAYFSLTAHYITPKDFEMKHNSLQCHFMPGSHDHLLISTAIRDSLRDWCIDLNEDVSAFTTDNGSNVVKAIEEDLDKVRLPCAGHTLNLSVQKAFEVPAVERAIGRAKKVVAHFNKSRLDAEELEVKQEMLGLPKHKLIQVLYIYITEYTTELFFSYLQGVSHRWNSVHDMIERLCEQQLAVCAVLQNQRSLLYLEHSPEEWRLLQDLCEILEPFKDATAYLSADQYPSLSTLGPLLAQIRLKLVITPADSSTAIRNVKKAIASDFNTRYKDPDVCMLMNKATLLDPRLKSLAHLTEDQQEATANSLVDEIVSCQLQPATTAVTTASTSENQSTNSSNAVSESSQSTKKCALEKLLGDTFSTLNASCDSSFSVSLTDLVVGELTRYKAEPVAELKEKPLEWWRTHHRSYPRLAKMAQKYLSIVATSVPSERLFSTAGIIVSAKRAALDPENVETLLFLHDNLPSLSLPYKRARH